nr:FFD TFG box motifs [Hymenolepis microstoma]
MERELREPSQFKTITKNSLIQIVTNVSYKYEGTVIAVNPKDQTISLQNVKFMGRDPHVKDANNDKDSNQQLPEIGFHIETVTFWLDSVKKVIILKEGKITCEIGDNAVKELSGKNISPAKNTMMHRIEVTSSNSAIHESSNDRRPRRPLGNARRGRNPEQPRTTYVPNIANRNRFNGPYESSNIRNETAYTKPTRNGGLVLYLPPSLTSLYRSNGLNIMPQSNWRSQGRRRGISERRNPSLRNSTIRRNDSEIAGQLAKLSLNSPTSEDRISAENNVKNNGKITDSGASGDSSTSITNAATESDGIQSLASGEYYIREKSFFDQISRSEGGPRGGPVNRGRSERGRPTRGFNRTRNFGARGNARRERELNIETFGQPGNRTFYNQRTGYVSRDLLVSATA